MSTEFFKYQGTGNDFILINNWNKSFDGNNAKHIQHMCDRKFGVGADGLMLVEKSDKADFKLLFFNPDASISFCGNGSRCAVRFALDQQLVKGHALTFEAFDGIHQAVVCEDGNVQISMRDVQDFKSDNNGIFVNTGAPHVVVQKKDIAKLEIRTAGSKIRYDVQYGEVGTNVNFIEAVANGIAIRTYEKGVEDETLSCGTGVTAAALVYAHVTKNHSPVQVFTKGGALKVTFSETQYGYTNVTLTGPAVFVFKGVFHE